MACFEPTELQWNSGLRHADEKEVGVVQEVKVHFKFRIQWFSLYSLTLI